MAIAAERRIRTETIATTLTIALACELMPEEEWHLVGRQAHVMATAHPRRRGKPRVLWH
jgi:hypothetical protein